MFTRPMFDVLRDRLQEPRRFMQVLVGPRQTGKTTLAHQIMDGLDLPSHYASADEPTLKDRLWIEQQWEVARTRMGSGEQPHMALLILDEIQKLPGWSETVKRLWDEDTARRLPLQVVMLGSSALLWSPQNQLAWSQSLLQSLSSDQETVAWSARDIMAGVSLDAACRMVDVE